ncbi:hypothetical protein M9Y10_038314 [Tritrichomonas musculus]|uniref:FPL domain-containing protein n=1 Tax=Tritrichomonas musculus TaxID=1915356 RepID=A0ABR2K831_9EUKA
MAFIPKKIFKPLQYTFPRNDEYENENFEFSKYQKHFKHMKDSKDSDQDFSQYYLAKICPDIAFHNLLEEMENEDSIGAFISYFINLLPDIVGISPSNILESIFSLKIIQQSKTYLSTIKLSLLCCRLSSECSFAVLIILLREAYQNIKDSRSHVVASFLQKILIAFSRLSDKSSGTSQIKDNEDSISFIPAFFEEFNKFLSQIFQYHVHVLSLRTISYMMQEFVDELDIMAPSPQYFNQYPQRCSIKSSITISLILGQVFNALSDLNEVAKKRICKLFVLAPMQVRDSIIYLLEKRQNRNSNDLVIVGFISYNNPTFLPKTKEDAMNDSGYLNNKIYRFTTHFTEIMNDTQSILEIPQFLHFVESNSVENEIDPLGIIALTTKITTIFPILLGKLEYDKFLLLSHSLSSLSRIIMNLFGNSSYSKIPILYYLDILLISPFATMPEYLTYPVEIIENHIKAIDSIILEDYEEWFQFIFDQQQQAQQQPQQQQPQQMPMFANLHVLSLIIHEKNELTSTFQMIQEKVQVIIRQSTILLQTLSFKALREIPEIWIDIVSFFTLFNLDDATKFAYITLRLLFNCLLSFHKSMNEEGSCYILQLLEGLIICPIYHFTICAYESMISSLTACCCQDNENNTNNSPHELFQSIHLLAKIFEKNGTNYEISAIFGLPTYPIILKIAKICVSCLKSNQYVEVSEISAKLLARIIENKYCRAIVQNVIKDVPDNYDFDEIEENTNSTVLELQSRIDEIVPNRIKKIQLGFQMWKQNFDNGTPIDVLVRFAHKAIFNQ